MSVYGIDLGTTNSCIATMDRNGNPQVIRNNADNTDTLPSVVFFENENNVVVGENAKQMIETDGDRVVDFIKRDIGRNDGRQKLTFFKKDYSPVDISAMILKRLKHMADEQGEDVNDVVITVPAYFGFLEQAATRKAGELAGLNVVEIVIEPVAAALSYCARQVQDEKTILVYDLGGGTFDVTIMKMKTLVNEKGEEEQKIDVLVIDGKRILGGKDWDDRLIRHITSEVCKDNGIEEKDLNSDTLQEIRSYAEVHKKKLTTHESAKVRITVDGSKTQVEVTRDEFETMTADLVTETMALVENALRKLEDKYPGTVIDQVLLVGGSTFMPMIGNAVEARFPGIVQMHDPNHAVALGAAIYCDLKVHVTPLTTDPDQIPPPGPIPPLMGTYTEPDPPKEDDEVGPPEQVTSTPEQPGGEITMISPRSFGLGVRDQMGEYVVDQLIKRDDPLPATITKKYRTPSDNMIKLEIRIFESMSYENTVIPPIDEAGEDQKERCNPGDNVVYLGILEMVLPPNTPAKTPIEVTITVNNGEIKVVVVNQITGESQDGTVHYSDLVKSFSDLTSLQIMDDTQ